MNRNVPVVIREDAPHVELKRGPGHDRPVKAERQRDHLMRQLEVILVNRVPDR
jgi:hypothetical protein